MLLVVLSNSRLIYSGISGFKHMRRLGEVTVSMGLCVCETRVCVFQAGDALTVKAENDPSVPSKEDIPTFDEWKKQVMEVEKEKSKCIHY